MINKIDNKLDNSDQIIEENIVDFSKEDSPTKNMTVSERSNFYRLHPDGDDQYDENRDNNL